MSETITVLSVIGRFLEHSRLFWFANGDEPELFVGSADWMPRNLDRRVEAVAPVEDETLRRQLEKLMLLYLEDTTAWVMHSDGQFSQRQPEGEQSAAQLSLMERWRGGFSNEAMATTTAR